jgi:hypothetical protein
MSQENNTKDYGNFFGKLTTKKLQDLVSEKNYLDEKLDVYAAAAVEMEMAAPKEAT